MSSRHRARSPHPALEPHSYYELQDHVRWADSILRLWESDGRRVAEVHGPNSVEHTALEEFAEAHEWRSRPLDTPARLVRSIRGMELRLKALEATDSNSAEQAVRLYCDARERATAFSHWIPSVRDRFPADVNPALGLQDIRLFFESVAVALATKPISAWLPGILAALDEIIEYSEQVDQAMDTPGSQAAMSGMAIIVYVAQLRHTLERYRDDPRGGEREYVFTCLDLCNSVEARYRHEERDWQSQEEGLRNTPPPLRVFRLTTGEIAGFRQARKDYELRGAAVRQPRPTRSGGGTPPRDSRPHWLSGSPILDGLPSSDGPPPRDDATWRRALRRGPTAFDTSSATGEVTEANPDDAEADSISQKSETIDARSARIPSEDQGRQLYAGLEALDRERRRPPRSGVDQVEPNRERRILRLVGNLADAIRPLRPLVERRPIGWPRPVELDLARAIQDAVGFLDWLADHWKCQPYTQPEPGRSGHMRERWATFRAERRPQLCKLALLIKGHVRFSELSDEESRWADRGEKEGYEPAVLNGRSPVQQARERFSALLREYWTEPRCGMVIPRFDELVLRRFGPVLTELRNVLKRTGTSLIESPSNEQPDGKPGDSRSTTPPAWRLAKAGRAWADGPIMLDYSTPVEGGLRTTSRSFRSGGPDESTDTLGTEQPPDVSQIARSKPAGKPMPHRVSEGDVSATVSPKIGGEKGKPTGKRNPIPPERRTRPLRLNEAAGLMGYKGKPKAKGKSLRSAIDRGAVLCFELTRQSFIFDLRDFPADSIPRVRPTS